MAGLNHNSMAAILKLTYRCDAFHNFVSFRVYDGVNLSTYMLFGFSLPHISSLSLLPHGSSLYSLTVYLFALQKQSFLVKLLSLERRFIRTSLLPRGSALTPSLQDITQIRYLRALQPQPLRAELPASLSLRSQRQTQHVYI